jgi:hypothetical protein
MLLEVGRLASEYASQVVFNVLTLLRLLSLLS